MLITRACWKQLRKPNLTYARVHHKEAEGFVSHASQKKLEENRETGKAQKLSETRVEEKACRGVISRRRTIKVSDDSAFESHTELTVVAS